MQHMKKENRRQPSVFAGFLAGAEGLGLGCRLGRAWTQPTGLQAPTTRTAGGLSLIHICYAYPTVKKVHILLNEYFRYLTEEGFIQKNPMQSVPMMRKANFLAAQDKECVPEQESVTVFTPTEIAKFKREAFATFANGKRKYQMCIRDSFVCP